MSQRLTWTCGKQFTVHCQTIAPVRLALCISYALVCLEPADDGCCACRSTNITAEALGSVRLVASNFSAEMWQSLNASVSERVTTTSQDVFINARDTIDASATDMSLGAGDTLDVVAQNKAAMLTTDFWLAAGHALDVFARVRPAHVWTLFSLSTLCRLVLTPRLHRRTCSPLPTEQLPRPPIS